jgi:hypothetical protein
MKKFFAKKVLKKYNKGGPAMDKAIKREFTEDVKLAGGGMRETKVYEDEITKPVKLAGGGYPMEDVLKKENYPKKAEGGYIKKDREELKSEVKGMGPEGKAFLRDKLSDKKYEGKLKGKYKGDLDKELYGMHKKGKKYMKNLLDQYDREGYKGQAHKLREALKKKKAKEDLKKKFAGHPSPHVKKIKHSLGQIIESKALKKKLREKENIPKKDIVKLSKGGDWIQGAVKKPGALRAVAKKDKLIKGDEKLSASDLNKLGAKAKKSGNSLLSKRVSLAKTFAKMRKK